MTDDLGREREEWVVASANPHKAAEMMALLGEFVDVIPRPTDLAEVVEDAPDLVGNARLKALAVRDATKRSAVADDSGLFVDALDGRPGVRSARFAGDDATDARNVAKLLSLLEGVAGDRRSAHFSTVIVLARSDGSELVAEGRVDGHIADTPVGDNGFGYDPVFIPDEGAGRTFAQMDESAKNAMSHRGRALRGLAALLAAER